MRCCGSPSGSRWLYGITIHTFIVGQPFRMRQFRRVLEHMAASSEEVWFTTSGQAAAHYAAQIPAPTFEG